MDKNDLAIADILKHPKFGLLSYQPAINGDSFPDDFIPVRNINFDLFAVKAQECDFASYEESFEYWQKNKP